MKTIADEWRLLEKVVIEGSGYTVREQREMKRSFYGGWLAALTVLAEASDESVFPGNETPEEARTRLTNEVMLFFKEMVNVAMKELKSGASDTNN